MNNGSPNLWDRALCVLENEIGGENFSLWLSPTKFHSLEGSTLTIAVPDALFRNWLASHYMGRIAEAVEKVASQSLDISFIVPDHSDALAQSPAPLSQTAERLQCQSSRLARQYSFSNFIVGESNRFAYAASRAVADASAKGYNPLFIYGGVGLGKTHLMQAIGNACLSQDPSSNVLYVTSEQFMNAFVDSVRSGKSLQFRNHYRNVGLLLIDDVQFFMGKESTQTEFFHTFNALHQSGRKIVVTSDRPPKDLNNLEERLRSRFEWGLIVDVQPPDLETRMAILRAKAQMHGIELPYDLAIYIAERIKTNIRKLEGVITQIKARADFGGKSICKEELREFLGPFLVGEEPKKTSPERVARIVCEYFDVEIEDLASKSRLRKHALPRHFAMYLCRHVAKLSFPETGRFFGNRDHSSVMHACKKIEKRIDSELNVQNLVTYLTKKVQEFDGA